MDAPEQIGLVEGLPGRWRLWTREDDGPHQDHAVRYVRADRLEAQEALLKEAMVALHQYVNDMRYPPERDSRDRRIAMAQTTLAKLRAHMGETE